MTIRPALVSFFVIAISISSSAQDITPSSLNRSCPNVSAANLYGNIVPGSLVIGPRLPDPSGLVIPASCSSTVDTLMRKWKREDLANFDSLENRVCSAYQGWVERVPGTCQAGGPPPICKVDHWYQNPGLSLQHLHADEQSKRAQREREMVDQGCSCYMQQAESQPVGQEFNKPTWNPYSPQALQPPAKDPNELPCSVTCPLEEYKCGGDGLCHAPSSMRIATVETLQKLNEMKNDTNFDLMKDAVKTDVFDILGKNVAAIFESTGARIGTGIVGGIFTPSALGMWSLEYENSLHQVDSDRASLGSSYQSLIGWLRGRNPWSSTQNFSNADWLRLNAELSSIRTRKQQLRQHLDAMNTALVGLQKEHELGPKVCYNVIGVANSRLNASAASLLSLPDLDPGAGR